MHVSAAGPNLYNHSQKTMQAHVSAAGPNPNSSNKNTQVVQSHVSAAGLVVMQAYVFAARPNLTNHSKKNMTQANVSAAGPDTNKKVMQAHVVSAVGLNPNNKTKK